MILGEGVLALNLITYYEVGIKNSKKQHVINGRPLKCISKRLISTVLAYLSLNNSFHVLRLSVVGIVTYHLAGIDKYFVDQNL